MLRTVLLTIALAIPAPALADITGTASVIDGDTIDTHGQHIRFCSEAEAVSPPPTDSLHG